MCQVRHLEKRFTRLPQQAFQASLVTKRSEHTWDDESCQAFINCVCGQDLIVETVCVAEELLHVRLFFQRDDQLFSVGKFIANARKLHKMSTGK